MQQKQIAIVGISLRFPGANTVDQFWNNLMSGTESVERYEEEQLNQFGVHPSGYESEQFVRASARLKDIDQFDHNFFNYSPKDASLLDPQQRLLLECGYEALEDAGMPVGSKSHEVGVFAGAYVSNYLIRNLGPMVSERSKSEDNVPFLYQCETDHLATNLAYRLNLTGPSISVQSWCTTAFSALYFGSRAIQNGDCNTAMVGAANIIVPQVGYYAPEGGLWSITGKTRSFDKEGDGCVSGSGVAVVILKELEEAIKDRNQIYALLKGVSVNNDGKSSAKLGYHGATVDGQYQAIKKTLLQSGVGTEAITYMEANGLATPLADRMELKALSKAFEGTNQHNKPWLGSIKPNIGHLLSASGMAALIKSCLICKYRMVPPLINHQKFSKVNQRMVDPNFQVNHEAIDLSTRRDPIICGMNSFGIGGSNAHAIVEEAPAYHKEKIPEFTSPQLITWSARTPQAIEQYRTDLQDYMSRHPELNSTDLSFSLNTSKGELAYRKAAIIDTSGKLRFDQTSSSIVSNEKTEVIWIFTGYGDTYSLEKFLGLYTRESVFKTILDQFFEYAFARHKKDFKSSFLNYSAEKGLQAELKSNILTIILNYAYGKLMMHWRIRPAKIVGISNGEYTAACLAGVFSFEEMIDVVIRQSAVINSLPNGKMITVIAEKAVILPLLESHELDLGGTYLSNAHVVSGDTDKCKVFCHSLEEKGIDYVPIDASFAFHSREVDPILQQVEKLYQEIDFQPPTIPLISTVTGQEIKEEIMYPSYWSRKMREPVLFAEAMSTINPENAVFTEFGPGDKFSSVLKYMYEEQVVQSYPVIKTHSEDAYESLLRLLGNLWQHGMEVDWQQFHSSKPGRKIPIPHYPFERQSFWLDYSKEQTEESEPKNSQKQPFENWFYTPSWKPIIQATKASTNQLADVKTWLVFTNGSSYTEAMIQWWRDQHQKVINVAIGESFQANEFQLMTNPFEAGGLKKVFDYLVEKGHAPDHVLYFWCRESVVTKESYRTLAYSAMIELVQGIDKIKAGKTWNLLIGIDSLFQLHAKDEISPEKSLILGPARTIPNEFPNITCQLIDLGDEFPYDELSKLVFADQSRILAERHGTLFEQYLAPIQESTNNLTASVFQSSGVYVLTGGLGGVGREISHYLFERFPGITLILIGRTEPGAIQLKESYQQLLELAKRTGGNLIYDPIDLGNQDQVYNWAENALKEYPNLCGILHLAGVQGGGMISFNDRKGKELTFDAKIDGSESLVAAFKSHPLDFFVMSSSSAALFGFFGLLDYSTANGFMDQLAHSLINPNTKYISINWDMWAVEGMAAGDGLGEAVEALRAKNKSYAIDTAQGFQALEQVLQWDLPQVAVLTRTPEEIMNDSNLRLESIIDIPPNKEEITDTVDNESLETHIIRIWKRIFERSDIGLHDNFFQLGGHSLSGVMFINKMKHRFPNLVLSLNEIFDHPTPLKVARLIEERSQKNVDSGCLKEQLWDLDTTERKAVLTEHVRSEINQLLKKNLTPQDSIPETRRSDVANHLYFHLKQEIELPLYAYEIAKGTDIEKLATYISHEFEVFHGLNPLPETNGQLPQVKAGPKSWKPEKKSSIQNSVFVCSAPRAGSTLLRLMLSGHSKLIAPPELWLLGSQTMHEWYEKVPGHVIQHGGVSSLLQSSGSYKEQEAHQQLQQYIHQDVPCFDVFQHIRSFHSDKIFIDKTPNYYQDPHVFDRIEDGFDNAKYIHLIRHPYATMDSIMKNRIYSLYQAYRDHPVKAAEHIWKLHNENIRQFTESIDPARSLVIRYEDLVTQPELTMKQLCEFLRISFEPKMVKPYSTGNMMAGDGDPNILNHDDIDHSLADVWKHIEFQPDLNEANIALANHYDYQVALNQSSVEAPAKNDLVAALGEEDLDDLLNQLA